MLRDYTFKTFNCSPDLGNQVRIKDETPNSASDSQAFTGLEGKHLQ